MIKTTLPIRIESEANRREHFHTRAKRANSQKATVLDALSKATPPGPGVYRITFTRIAPRKLDGDNLQRGFKAVRDGVCQWLGVDDGSDNLLFVYRQARGKPKQYAATIELEPWSPTVCPFCSGSGETTCA